MPNKKTTKKSIGQVSKESRLKEVINIEPIGEMVLIPKGKFKMGLSEKDYKTIVEEIRNIPQLDEAVAATQYTKDQVLEFILGEIKDREMPQQEIELPAYYISREPVKRSSWLMFLRDGGHKKSDYWIPSLWQQVAEGIKTDTDIVRHYINNPPIMGDPEEITAQIALHKKMLNVIEKYGIVGTYAYTPMTHIFPEDLPEDIYQDMVLSWGETYAFCRWLGRTTDDPYFFTLPFESEWEKAVKGGNDFIWPWGDSLKETWLKHYPCTPSSINPAIKHRAPYLPVWDCFLDEESYFKAQNGYGLLGVFTHRDVRRAAPVHPSTPLHTGTTFLPTRLEIPEWTASVYQKYPYAGKLMNLEADVWKNWRTTRGGHIQSQAEQNIYRHDVGILRTITIPGKKLPNVNIEPKANISMLNILNLRCSGARGPSNNSLLRFRVVARNISKVEEMDAS